MPVVEKVSGGAFYHRGLDRRLSQGDRADVNEELAEYLVEDRADFEIVDVQDADFREVDDEQEGENSGFDAEEFVGRTPMDDVTDEIHAGEVDDHLDAVAEAADRVGVEDAVGERRAELEE